ncbi:MAG: nicotinamide mononucleotide transporter, partial [Verrucomicrobiota bacterium]|nr:nicotinamide mononucleotide transporter [Verrucomicrobiota bacterium]
MNSFLTQLSSISIIDWFAMLTGILGVYLSIKEKILAWPLFILCYATYVYISFRGNYYAFGGMNVIFTFVAAYGWLGWFKSSKNS